MMRVLRHPLETSICCLLAALTVVVFSQVIARYVLQAPLSWSEELARFLLMWLSMLSAAYAFRKKSHFALRIIVERLPLGVRSAVAVCVNAVVAAFFILIFYQGVKFVIGVSGHIAPALQIPMEIPFASVVVGSILIVWEIALSTWRLLRKRETVHSRFSDP
ncbi:MAG: TRAP transporter small permease [Albidovulum sp.]|nr:TRAP transporter small permease [Albidovulum sp.]